MLTRIGDIENGNIATGGRYALTTTNVNPYLSPGQEIQFEVLVRNAVLPGTHYDVDCVVE